MSESKFLTFRDILYVFFKNINIIRITFLTSLILAIVYCFITAPEYRAETKILIKLGKEQMSGIEQMRSEAYSVQFQERKENTHNEMELITGQFLTEKVLSLIKDEFQQDKERQEAVPKGIMHTLFVKPLTAAEKMIHSQLARWGILKEENDNKKWQLAFMKALKAEFIEDTDMIKLSFTWTSPYLAALAANTYADEYVTQHTKVNEMTKSFQFYTDQIQLFERKLTEAEDELQNFINKTNISNILLQKELLIRNITELNNRYQQAAVELDQAKAKLRKVSSMSTSKTGWIETPELGSETSDKLGYLRTLDEMYFRMEVERQRLLKNYKPESSEISAVDSQMTNLRKQKSESILNLIDIELSLKRTKMESLAGELAQEEKKLVNLNGLTTQLRQLEREKEIIETNYLIYKKKSEELRISDDLDKRRISSVRIATPALPPLEPVHPQKALLIGLAAFIGLFIGFGLSATVELFDNKFKDTDDLSSIMGMPALMAVPFVAVAAGGGKPGDTKLHKVTGWLRNAGSGIVPRSIKNLKSLFAAAAKLIRKR